MNNKTWQELLQELKEKVAAKGLRQADIAEAIGKRRSAVNRAFNSQSAPRLDFFVEMCEAAGLEIFLLELEEIDSEKLAEMEDYLEENL